MSATHTPGPWRVATDGCEVTTAPVGVLTSSGRICDTMSYYRNATESMANARLIAAAPDLLEALLAVVSVADRKTDEFDLAHAAIAKATGAA